MDYVFIAAISLSMVIWSGIIIATGQLSKWLGYYGLFIVVVTMPGLFMKFNFVSEFGFGIYIFGLMSWLIFAAALLVFSSKKVETHE
jgi:hypothetical protein